MGRKRNIKRRLPSVEVVTFGASRTISKRRLVMRTPNLAASDTRSDGEHGNLIEHPPTQSIPHSVDRDDDGNQADDEEIMESDAESENVSQYRKRQQRSAEGWKNVRDAMLQAVIESEWLPDGCLCSNCSVADALFRSLACGASVFYCESCVSIVHRNRNVFHDIEEWKASSLTLSYVNGVTIYSTRDLDWGH